MSHDDQTSRPRRPRRKRPVIKVGLPMGWNPRPGDIAYPRGPVSAEARGTFVRVVVSKDDTVHFVCHMPGYEPWEQIVRLSTFLGRYEKEHGYDPDTAPYVEQPGLVDAVDPDTDPFFFGGRQE